LTPAKNLLRKLEPLPPPVPFPYIGVCLQAITISPTWGNSLTVRIPKALADAVKASDGRRAEIKVENGTLVLPAHRQAGRLGSAARQ
jgi:hypothetical protein